MSERRIPAWRTAYRQGSFRGAPFSTEESEAQGGRRVATHEYPQRDEPFAEDLGRKARRFRLDCFVAGGDYRSARDRLLDALEAPGPGELIHPFRGPMSVAVDEFSYRESAIGGGVCAFSIGFVEAGQPVSAPISVDTGAAIAQLLASGTTIAAENFERRFSVAGTQALVEEASAAIVAGTARVALASAAALGGAGPMLHAFEAGLILLPAPAATLARQPLSLARSMLGMIDALSSMGIVARARIGALLRVLDYAEQLPPVVGGTSARQRQRTNQAALVSLVRTGVAAALVRAAAEVRFVSYDEAAALRDQLADRLDDVAIALADAHDDIGAELVGRLRQALIRDITARGGQLSRVRRWHSNATRPALTLAQSIEAAEGGGAVTVLARADDIVARNRVAHPLFVRMGELELVGRVEAIS